jgi:hypothetical protein
VAGCCEHGDEPSDSCSGGNLLNSQGTAGFSRTLLHVVGWLISRLGRQVVNID